MRELILIRHGEAEHLTGDDDSLPTGGWTDTPLTDIGRRQARDTGHILRRLLQDKLVNFYSSDLIRAQETAEIIGKFISGKPVFAAELRELNN